MLRFVVLCILAIVPVSLGAQDAARPSLEVPRLDHPPSFDDFLDMQPDGETERAMVRVDGFVQQEPSDGLPSSQRTEAYLGYDVSHLYVVFVAFDTDPSRIRGRLTRREDVFNDDFVTVQVDTFNDQRRSINFVSNPLGVQADTVLTEARGLNFDASFDTVWQSKGRITDRGYVVWMAIPFRSLRFPAVPEQRWGIILSRENIRSLETVFWPPVSSRIQSRLIQNAELRGLRDISPGHNAQVIPYAFYRAFEATSGTSPGSKVHDAVEPAAGLDAKIVAHDSVVLDLTVNPDFSQVESDEPQVTANQRFEVFFPERRPFFLENANVFQTPISVLFTRRVVDPNAGARVTGKVGAYTIGALVMDDQGRDGVAALRLSRDIGSQSTVGAIYTERNGPDVTNRVGGVDGRFSFGPHWSFNLQSVMSATRLVDGGKLAGPAHEAELRRSGRQFNASLRYTERSEGFRTDLGFEPRSGIRRVFSHLGYQLRPENRWLVAYGPNFDVTEVWAPDGRRLDELVNPWFTVLFRRSSSVSAGFNTERERLRPGDAPNVTNDLHFERLRWRIGGTMRVIPPVTVTGSWASGQSVNLRPAGTTEPRQGPSQNWSLTVTLQPVTPLRLDTTWLSSSLATSDNQSVFRNRIVRSKVNWQVTRELAIRAIAQHDSTRADARYSALPGGRRLNVDFLMSYVINPWTAFYIGYNGNGRSFDSGEQLLRDAQQFFMKVSYLHRF